MGFAPGDRVKLTERVAASKQRGFSPTRRGSRMDWTNRVGTVTGCKPGWSDIVTVAWDGRKSGDIWPAVALEKIGE